MQKYKCKYTNGQLYSVSVSQGHGIMVELCDVSLIL